eukprot:236947-Pyramimonas_sp.AAC.1
MSVSTKYPHRPKDGLRNHLPPRIQQPQLRLGRPVRAATPPHGRCQGSSTGCPPSIDGAAQPPSALPAWLQEGPQVAVPLRVRAES